MAQSNRAAGQGRAAMKRTQRHGALLYLLLPKVAETRVLNAESPFALWLIPLRRDAAQNESRQHTQIAPKPCSQQAIQNPTATLSHSPQRSFRSYFLEITALPELLSHQFCTTLAVGLERVG